MNDRKKFDGSCASRREFLLAGGVGAALMMTGGSLAPALAARVKKYPRKKITSLRQLTTDKPIIFSYPDNKSKNIMVKLGVEAGGGVGPDKDIVAFNTLCTHMGGDLGLKAGSKKQQKEKGYKPKDKAYGPCPFHLSTFDLTKHGMIIAGHATQSLPQILLEVVKKNVYAVGVQGLIYGRAANLGQKYGEVIEPNYKITPESPEPVAPIKPQKVPKPEPVAVEPPKRKIFDDLRGKPAPEKAPRKLRDKMPEPTQEPEESSDRVFESSPLKSRRRPR